MDGAGCSDGAGVSIKIVWSFVSDGIEVSAFSVGTASGD